MPRKSRQLAKQRRQLSAVPDASGAIQPSRDRLLRLAGVDEVEQAKLLRSSIDLLASKLSAERVQRLVVRDGKDSEKVEEFTDTAHDVQLRAATELLSVVGAYPSKNTGASASGQPIQVNVVLADYLRPPAQVEVIEAGK